MHIHSVHIWILSVDCVHTGSVYFAILDSEICREYSMLKNHKSDAIVVNYVLE